MIRRTDKTDAGLPGSVAFGTSPTDFQRLGTFYMFHLNKTASLLGPIVSS